MKKLALAVALTAFIGSYSMNSYGQDEKKETKTEQKKCCKKGKKCCKKGKKETEKK